MPIASYIDHTLLKQTATNTEIATLCSEAREYGFATVCVPTIFIKDAAAALKGSSVKVVTVIGFPFGYTYINAKAEEARQAIKMEQRN